MRLLAAIPKHSEKLEELKLELAIKAESEKAESEKAESKLGRSLLHGQKESQDQQQALEKQPLTILKFLSDGVLHQQLQQSEQWREQQRHQHQHKHEIAEEEELRILYARNLTRQPSRLPSSSSLSIDDHLKDGALDRDLQSQSKSHFPQSYYRQASTDELEKFLQDVTEDIDGDESDKKEIMEIMGKSVADDIKLPPRPATPFMPAEKAEKGSKSANFNLPPLPPKGMTDKKKKLIKDVEMVNAGKDELIDFDVSSEDEYFLSSDDDELNSAPILEVDIERYFVELQRYFQNKSSRVVLTQEGPGEPVVYYCSNIYAVVLAAQTILRNGKGFFMHVVANETRGAITTPVFIKTTSAARLLREPSMPDIKTFYYCDNKWDYKVSPPTASRASKRLAIMAPTTSTTQAREVALEDKILFGAVADFSGNKLIKLRWASEGLNAPLVFYFSDVEAVAGVKDQLTAFELEPILSGNNSIAVCDIDRVTLMRKVREAFGMQLETSEVAVASLMPARPKADAKSLSFSSASSSSSAASAASLITRSISTKSDELLARTMEMDDSLGHLSLTEPLSVANSYSAVALFRAPTLKPCPQHTAINNKNLPAVGSEEKTRLVM